MGAVVSILRVDLIRTSSRETVDRIALVAVISDILRARSGRP